MLEDEAGDEPRTVPSGLGGASFDMVTWMRLKMSPIVSDNGPKEAFVKKFLFTATEATKEPNVTYIRVRSRKCGATNGW